MVVSEDAFREALETLDERQFGAFVADLWAARGRETHRDGNRVRSTAPHSDRQEVLYPVTAAPEEGVPDDADIVLTAREATTSPNGVVHLGPAELYQLVRFGIDSEVSRRLLREHLGLNRSGQEAADRPVDGSDRAPAAGDGTDDISDGGRPGMTTGNEGSSGMTPEEADGGTETSAVSRRTVLAGFGGFLVGAGVVAAVTGAGSAGSTSDGGTGSPDGSPEIDGPVAVPGVSAEGVVDPAALADSHATFFGSHSYTLSSRRLILDADGRLRSSLSATVRHRTASNYLTDARAIGPDAPGFLSTPPVQATFWSEAGYFVSKVDSRGETRYASVSVPRPVETQTFGALSIPFGEAVKGPREFFRTAFFDVPTTLEATMTVQENTAYRLTNEKRTRSSPTEFGELVGVRDIRDMRLLAELDERGFVRSFFLRYDSEMGGTHAEVFRTLEYSRVGTTTVERPAWTDKALNR